MSFSSYASRSSILAKMAAAWPFWLAAILLAAGQALYLGLSMVSLDQFETGAVRLLKVSALERQVGRLTTVAALGLAPASYTGLGDEVRRLSDRSGAPIAAIVDPRGNVVSGLGLSGAGFSGRLALPLGPFPEGEPLDFESGSLRWLASPVYAPDGHLWGLACVSSGDTSVGDRAMGLAASAVGGFGLAVLIVSAGLTGLAMVWGVRRHAKGDFSKLGLYIVILAPFLLGQAVFTLNSFPDLTLRYLELSRSIASQVLRNLAADLDRISSSGVDLAKVASLPPHLANLHRSLPEAEALLIEAGGLSLSSPPSAARPPEPLIVSVNLSKGGQVHAWLNAKALRAARIDLALDNLFLTLVTVLLLIEMARVLAGDLALRLKEAPPGDSQGFSRSLPAGPVFRFERLRLVIFIAVMCVDFPLAFIPLKMASITKIGSAIPREVLLGLPVAMMSLMTGAGMLISGRLGTGRRVASLVTIGLFVAALGAFLSALSASPLLFVLALGLSGLGYGLMNLPFNLIAATSLGSDHHGEAFSDIAASFFAGGTCGCLIGGLLADRFGYDVVFGVGAAVFALLAAFWRVLSPIPPSLAASFPERRKGSGLIKGLLVFLSRRRPLALILLSLFPVCAAMVGLLNYFLPLRLMELGYGPSMAGRLNFLMSMIIIVLAPKLGRAMDRSGRVTPWLVGAGLAAALSSVSYLAWSSLWGPILAMAFLGLSQAVTESGHSAAFMRLPESAELGSNNALGLASAFSRASQTAGPVLLGGALGLWGLGGLAVFGGAIAFMSLAYG
ncbi:MAG: MFS transporter, partial [Deltaproteobacteria bacterium]|nr:MFS transporter [Deltaproteobacteria bacterium]